MNWDAFGNFGNLIGPIAVLTTLFLLSTQSKQNSLATKSGAAESMPSAGRDVALATASTESRSDIWVTARKEYNSLSESEKSRVKLFYESQMMATVNVYSRYKQGKVEEEIWIRQSNWMRAFLETAAGKAVWAEQVSGGGVPKDFIEYCEFEYREQLKGDRSVGK
ncbi:MAG: hypothetical protein NPIRA05_01470 [Nitrospirales bacterium]|nr:MAG: hypothetical protein NPIRA05_01470 [Nitrospirales bacterium]